MFLHQDVSAHGLLPQGWLPPWAPQPGAPGLPNPSAAATIPETAVCRSSVALAHPAAAAGACIFANDPDHGGGEVGGRSCATARAALLARGAAKLGVAADAAGCRDGAVFVAADPARRVGYGELAVAAPLALAVDPKITLKKPTDYQWIGKSIARVDIPGKLTGEWTYVHDFRLPGMLHARVLRPFTVGASLLSVDDSAAAKVEGYERTVRKGDFLAVLAKTEWGAIKVMRAIKVEWGAAELLPEQATVFDHWRSLKVAKRDNITAATTRKWQGCEDRQDRSHRPHTLSASLSPAQAAREVELRRSLLLPLPLDDLLRSTRQGAAITD